MLELTIKVTGSSLVLQMVRNMPVSVNFSISLFMVLLLLLPKLVLNYFFFLVESISLHPSAKAIQSGNNIRVRGLCYRPHSDFFCDFGEVRIAKAHRLSDSEVMCSVPFITTKMEMVISFNSSKREFLLSKVFILGKSSSWFSQFFFTK